MAKTPTVDPPRHATRTGGERGFGDPPPRRRAFVVDDDPTTRLLLEDLAGELGWHAERFASLAALRLALARDVPDLIILDDELPDGTGGDFIAEMRSQHRLRRLPIVICTGAPAPRRRLLGRLAPVIAKPFDLLAFERIVLDVAGAG